MSHIVQIQTEVRDPAAIAAACVRLGLKAPQEGTHQVYVKQATGHAVWLEGWKFPVVCDTVAGAVSYDNYNGHWGEQQQLDRFLQAYAVEKAQLEAKKAGHRVVESQLDDGSIRLQIQVGGW